MTITKSIHIERVDHSDSLNTLPHNIKIHQQHMNKTGINKTSINSQEGNTLTSKATLTPKPKPKSIMKKHSSLKSDSNPLTISRKIKIEKCEPLKVHFNEKVIVHEVAKWNPCGHTFPDYSFIESVP
eukprot:100408_1